MGKVWRARHIGLRRDDALKVLPDAFATDPERLARFQREAQVLASLNHPNIAHVYGLEQADGVQALVMELVEGPTLADRIAQGPIPVDEALPIAKQIAEALEAAHEQGIIHRDLKPANIKVRPDGTVKVLDFGLAKALEPVAVIGADATASPTITSPALTQMGIILGTAAYMSPEQAKGRQVDKRTDVWAFGAVVYEMLSGQRAFKGDDISDTLAAVLRQDIDWMALPPSTPASVRRLIARCLDRDAKRRLRDIGEARIVLDDPVAPARGDVGGVSSFAPPQSLLRRAIPIAAALFVGALLAAGSVWLLIRPAAPSVVRTTVTTSGSTALAPSGGDHDVAITSDGLRIVYRNNNQVLVRALDQLEPTVLSGDFSGAGPRDMFLSPDGQWVGFFQPNAVMKKVAITGGPPVTVLTTDGASRGATWSEDGTIIFATLPAATGLQRVSAAGGEPTVLTKPDRKRGERDHFWPRFLPGGQAVLFTIIPVSGGIESAQIAVLDLRTGTSKVLIRGGSDAHYVPTGHLVYGVAGTVRAVAFDLQRLEVVGTPAPVVDGVVTTDHGAVDVAVAANGSLVYVPGGAGDRQTVVSVDRQGRASPLPGLPPGSYLDVRVSPDGAQLAVATDTDVWTYDFARATLSRLTTHTAADSPLLRSPGLSPLWTPDGKRIIFSWNRAGYPELLSRPADGTGSDEPFLARAKDLIDLRPIGWSPDGRQLLFSEAPPGRQRAIWQTAIERPSDAKLLLSSSDYATVSPDGRWIAYESTVSGRSEILRRTVPGAGKSATDLDRQRQRSYTALVT